MKGYSSWNYGLELFNINRKAGEKSKMESFMNCFHIYSKHLIFSFFLKEEKDWELMTSLSSEL